MSQLKHFGVGPSKRTISAFVDVFIAFLVHSLLRQEVTERERNSSPKNENSVISQSPSCCSKLACCYFFKILQH